MKTDDNPLPNFLNRNPKGTEPMTTATAKTKKKDCIIVTVRAVFDVGSDLQAASKAAKAFQDAPVPGAKVEETKLTLGKRDAG